MPFPRLRPIVIGAAVVASLTVALAGCSSSSSDSGSGSGASAAAGESLAAVKKAGVLVVGTEGTYRPFTFHENGTSSLTGYDVDVITAVADKLGVKPKFEETQWDAIFAGLTAGRFDVIANQVSITDEREAKYSFSTPYTVSPGVIVVKKDNTDISSFADLKGKKTAQSLTSNWYELATKSGADVQNVEGWAQAVTLLEQGRVDATINDSLTYLDYKTQKNDTRLKVAATTDDVSKNAFVFRQGSDDLVDAVDTALDELRADGTLAKISEKYFGEDVSK